MARKIPRTIYFSPEVDELVTQLMKTENRARTGQVEHMIKKCVEYRQKMDEIALSMAEPRKRSRTSD